MAALGGALYGALDLDADGARLPAGGARVFAPSWNAAAPVDVDLRCRFVDGAASAWLPLARTAPPRSTSARDGDVAIEVDVVRAARSTREVELRARGLRAAYLAVMDGDAPAAAGAGTPGAPIALDAPARSQYVGGERGWCSAAALTMLMRYWIGRGEVDGPPPEVPDVARAIHDAAYGGTGNWAFAVAHAATAGFAGAVVRLRGAEDARALLETGLPFAAAIAWREGELPGAPLPASPGHLVVVRGLDAAGDPLVHDPARDPVAGAYPAAAFFALWARAGGMGYVVAPEARRAAFEARCLRPAPAAGAA